MQCWLYMLWDLFKHVYGYRHVRPVSITGIVLKVYGTASDGDYTFDIKVNQPLDYRNAKFDKLHCEITPCNRNQLKSFIEELEYLKKGLEKGDHGINVEINGCLTWDPPHLGGPDCNLEIHPVLNAKVLN